MHPTFLSPITPQLTREVISEMDFFSSLCKVHVKPNLGNIAIGVLHTNIPRAKNSELENKLLAESMFFLFSILIVLIGNC